MAINTTSKKLITNRGITTSITSGTGTITAPTISLVKIADSSYNILDDTALGTTGGYLIITGTDFKSGCTVYINNTSVTTSFISSTQLRVTAPSIVSGTYSIIVFNPDKAGAIYLNLTTSPFPSFTTSAGSLGTVYETNTVNVPVTATSDSTVTYAITSGSLPPNISLNSATGLLSGTTQLTGSNTTYTFVIDATDAENQNSSRSFSLTINTDVVTWSSPDSGTTINGNVGTSVNQALLATSAAGKTITYTANQLPAGLSISGSNVIGTPTTGGSLTSIFTATATTTNRSAARTINWFINLVTDTYFPYVSLLLQTSSTNTQQNNTFLDSSTNNFSITRNGTLTQGSFTPYKPDGNWSNYFNGAGDYLTVGTGSTDYLGTGDFTFEAWIYKTGTNNGTVAGKWIASAGWVAWVLNNNWTWTGSGTSVSLNGTINIALNTWYHVVVCRSGNNWASFVNGVRDATASSANTPVNNASISLQIAGFESGNSTFPGYISNIRIIKGGTAIYNPTLSTLTVPVAPLTPISNTALLICQSNRFKDNSTNTYIPTIAGTPKIQSFQPFNLTWVYSPVTYGGSGYFNGTTDYLSLTDSSNIMDLGGATASLEMWIYPISSNGCFITKGGGAANYSTTNGAEYTFAIVSSVFTFYSNANGTSQALTDSITRQLNTWYHIVIATNTTTQSLFVNGTRTATLTSSIVKPATRTSIRIGLDSSSTFYSGYISNLRMIQGSGAYDASQTTYTLPTNPVTAITNTNLLLNFSNAGIYDAATQSSIITVGTAQVNTSVKQWSPSSIKFSAGTDAISIASSSAFGLGTGNFTIEFWLYLNATTKQTIVSMLTTTASIAPNIYYANASGIRYSTANVDRITGGALSTGVWYYIALVRTSGSTKMYINGTQTGSTYADANDYGTANPVVVGDFGVPLSGTSTLNGYVQDLRITKDIARSFTTPTAAFSGS